MASYGGRRGGARYKYPAAACRGGGVLRLITRAGRLFLCVVVAVAFLAFAAPPASAAEKVFEDRMTNVSVPIGDAFAVLPESVCGVAGPFDGELLINTLQFVMWDNGHFLFTTTNSVRLFDSAGNQVLLDRITVHNEGGPTTLPNSFGISLVSHCTKDSATPGKLYETHFTVTVGEDGTIRQLHGSFCDPETYPFC